MNTLLRKGFFTIANIVIATCLCCEQSYAQKPAAKTIIVADSSLWDRTKQYFGRKAAEKIVDDQKKDIKKKVDETSRTIQKKTKESK